MKDLSFSTPQAVTRPAIVSTFYPRYTNALHQLYHNYLVANITVPIAEIGTRLAQFWRACDDHRAEIMFADTEFCGRILIALAKVGMYHHVTEHAQSDAIAGLRASFTDTTFTDTFFAKLDSNNLRKFVTRGMMK